MEKHENTTIEEDEEEEDGPPPGWSKTTPTYPSDGEMGQMVCGGCRQLLSYPKGSTRVQCSSCHILNFVLQAHEVGNVKCGTCSLLLMYPYGAPSVRCSSCRSVSEIGEHNKRLPWSEQQGHTPQTADPVNE